jgi:DNA polymerase-1
MLEDLRNDVLDTWEVYKKQLELISTVPKLYNLFRLHCDDLVVLAEMEWNGLPFNEEKAKAEADKLRAAISVIEEELRSHCQGVPINFDSPEHISAFLYGGIIKENKKILVGIYKSGGKAGQPRYNNREVEYALPQMVKPLEGSSLAKDGYWSTDESVLRQLTGAKKIRDLLLERSKLSKELDYMQGLPDLIDEMDWPRNSLHGSFNQCVASTGRLSSSRPNKQNLTDSVLQLIESQRN